MLLIVDHTEKNTVSLVDMPAPTAIHELYNQVEQPTLGYIPPTPKGISFDNKKGYVTLKEIGVNLNTRLGHLSSHRCNVYLISQEDSEKIQKSLSEKNKQEEADAKVKADLAKADLEEKIKQEEARREAIKEEARRTGKKQALSRGSGYIQRNGYQVEVYSTVWAMPDGTTKRTETSIDLS